ncbi:MAG: hypothetical protein WCQ94_06155 [Lachnospiraceae bacterium]
MGVIELKQNLVEIISTCSKIKAIGQTGSLDEKLIPGKSDIDLFVLCSEIPTMEDRNKMYNSIQNETFELQMEVCDGGQWGYGDILVSDGIDVMPMYFTVREMCDYLEEVLNCKHLEKEGRFYPVGRVASIATIHVLYEKDNTWTDIKDMVNQKPMIFFQKWYKNEISQVIDEEDLGRSELRKEVLFFHQVLENALDHLLQALYAVNKCYFPSRKRTMSAINDFQYRPVDCYERLLHIVQDGTKEETIVQAINELRRITAEVRELGHIMCD